MSGVTLTTSPRNLALAARHPSMVLVRRVSRIAGRSGRALGCRFWVLHCCPDAGLHLDLQDPGITRSACACLRDEFGLNALLGLPHAMNTVAGWAEWRFVGILGAIGCIWGLLTSTRLMRGEEEAGRYELLLAGQTTRLRAAMPGARRPRRRPCGTVRCSPHSERSSAANAASVGFSLGRCLPTFAHAGGGGGHVSRHRRSGQPAGNSRRRPRPWPGSSSELRLRATDGG